MRQLLITAQQLGTANKGIEGVQALQPGGEGSRIAEIEMQTAAAREMAAANQGNENIQAAVALYLQQMTAEEDQILLKTGGVAVGFHAWLDELQAVESEAQSVKGLMDQSTKGLESTGADSIVKIIESHRDQHQKLIHELRGMWESYFASLAKMAIQHGLQKLLAPIAGGVEKMLGIAPKVGKDAALTTNTLALQQLTAAITAKAGVGGGAGAGGLLGLIPGAGGAGAGGAGAGAADITNLEGFAEGGNVSPGGSFISGEAGAERVDLERGGAHVTPLGFTSGGGGDVHNHYDMRGAVVTDDLLRKAEAAEMMEHTRSSAVAAAVSISRESSLRARPQR